MQCDRGHRAHAVRGAGRTFEFCCQNGHKRKGNSSSRLLCKRPSCFSEWISYHTQMLRIILSFVSRYALCKHNRARNKKQPEKSFRLRVVDGQDSLISGAEMLAFESGACSVTEGHRAHNVCGAERTFEPVVDTNSKRKTLLFSRVLMLVEATGLEPVTSRM